MKKGNRETRADLALKIWFLTFIVLSPKRAQLICELVMPGRNNYFPGMILIYENSLAPSIEYQ